MTTALAPAPRATAIPHARFRVSRVILAGRGATNGPDAECGEEVIYENRAMTLWQVVAELATCDEVSCSRKATSLRGSEYATTTPRRVDGWDETELVMVRRGDGTPIGGAMLLWLFRAAGLIH